MFPLEKIGNYAPRLKWIHIIGAGVEHLAPMSWLPDGVTLTNNRGAHAPKTYEYAMMSILMLGNHIPRLVSSQRKALWDGHFVSVVKGDTVVIVGAGKQGSAVARAAKNLGLTAIGVDPDKHEREYFDRLVVPKELHNVLPLADYVGLTVPFTPETKYFFGDEEFRLMKPEAGFFNICRGKVLDTDALLRALDGGGIAGAVLDVFETEPLPSDSPLWSAPNLIMTPHMGCDDDKNYIPRTYDIVFENIRRLLNGEKLENIVDPNLGY
jgi:phosphoglycerate dehydrogenase-like enzyme